jgi:hypothetical protein
VESVFEIIAEPNRRAIVSLEVSSQPSVGEIERQQADAPKMLEYNWGDHDMRWELETFGGGTRLTLWTNIGRRFIAMGAAGWHICFNVLERLLAGEPIGRIVGPEAMKFGWQRLQAEYAKQFGIETPDGPSQKGRTNHERGHHTFDFSMDSHYIRHSDNRVYL